MLIVVSVIALVVAISFPSITMGIDSLRLRTAASSVIGAFNLALTRADRLQEAVDVTISAAGHFVAATTLATRQVARTELPAEIKIAHVYPEVGAPAAEEAVAPPDRHFIVYPNGAVPRITIELENEHGVRRFVLLDPITGVARERVLTDPQAEQPEPEHQDGQAAPAKELP